jgi:NADH-quinone oxidoreductase subunit G
VIVGGAALKVPGGQAAALALVSSLNLVREGWNGFNVLHTAAARTGGLMLGYAQPGGMAALAQAAPEAAVPARRRRGGPHALSRTRSRSMSATMATAARRPPT